MGMWLSCSLLRWTCGVVDVVVDEEMELVVGVTAFVYDPYRMI